MGREKALASAGHVHSPVHSLNIPEKLIYMQPAGFALTEVERTTMENNNIANCMSAVCQYFRVCAIQKLKIHLIAYYSNVTSL